MRLAVVIALTIMAAATSASAGNTIIGAGVVYGSGIDTPGGQVHFLYSFRNERDAEFTTFRFGLDGDAFFPNGRNFGNGSSRQTWLDANANGQWVFFEPDNFPLDAYVLLGLNVARVSTVFTYDPSATVRSPDSHAFKAGANVGGGVDYKFGEMVAMFGEAKYVISSADQFVATIGVRFTLPNKHGVAARFEH